MRTCPMFISIVIISGAWKGTHGNRKTVLKMRKCVKCLISTSKFNFECWHEAQCQEFACSANFKTMCLMRKNTQHYSKEYEKDKVCNLET